jgi:hypothetical protein
MSIEREPSQTIEKKLLPPISNTKFLMNFRYTIGMALKNAIIGNIFAGQAQGVGFSLKKDNFQRPNVSRSKADFDPRPHQRKI